MEECKKESAMAAERMKQAVNQFDKLSNDKRIVQERADHGK